MTDDSRNRGKTLRDYLEDKQFDGRWFVSEGGRNPYVVHRIVEGSDPIFQVSYLARARAYNSVVPEEQQVSVGPCSWEMSPEEFKEISGFLDRLRFIQCTFLTRDCFDGLWVENGFNHYIGLDNHLDDREVFLDSESTFSFEPEERYAGRCA